jgi:GGDEF domain-containing protein
MINPKILDKIIGVIGFAFASAIALLAYLNPEKIGVSFTHAIFDPTVTLRKIELLSLIFIPLLALSYFWNYFLFKERAEHNNTLQRLAAAEGERKKLDLLRYTDVVTRIPNQLQWEDDLESIQSELANGEQFQCIIIDLDGFKAINDKFGWGKADAAMLHFAQTLYGTMRRNEKIYKRPFERDPTKLWTRIYRKYTGGDEFIFLIRGPEEEALGFLTRLHKMSVGPIKSEIDTILGANTNFDFHGAICPVFNHDNATTAITRLVQVYKVGQQRGIRRVHWYSDKKSKDIDQSTNRRLRQFYEDAEIEFAI